MDFLRDLGLLALGSRLRRLSDRLIASGSEIYRSQRLDLDPGWFPLFRLLADRGPQQVGEAARTLGLTQPAVSQTARAMEVRGLLQVRRDPTDARRRILDLSRSARGMVPSLRELWLDIEAAITEVVESTGVDLLATLDGIETSLQKADLAERTLRRHQAPPAAELRIEEYSSSLAPHFAAINRQWIEQNFAMEPTDVEMLEDPQGVILDKGGQIFFACKEDQVVGTCAMDRQGDRFELIKMGVYEHHRGLGAGRVLLNHALKWARRQGVDSVYLVTNSSAVPAIELYRSVGFRVTSEEQHPKYRRGNLTMELAWDEPSERGTS